jgi:hypothetical protein
MSAEDIARLVTLFSLGPRGKWEDPPAGFDFAQDIMPWRFNRRLSYLRRPLVIGPEPADDPWVYWGPRNVSVAGTEQLALVLTGRYKTHPGSSPEMISLIGRINNERGHEFTLRTAEWLRSVLPPNWTVDTEVGIGPGRHLSDAADLGDIDVLLLDRNEDVAYSVECKDLQSARNPHEFAAEIERLTIGDRDGTSLIEKHMKRDQWLRQHAAELRARYPTLSKDLRVVSLFVTSAEVPSAYLADLPMSCLALPRLRREGLGLLTAQAADA